MIDSARLSLKHSWSAPAASLCGYSLVCPTNIHTSANGLPADWFPRYTDDVAADLFGETVDIAEDRRARVDERRF